MKTTIDLRNILIIILLIAVGFLLWKYLTTPSKVDAELEKIKQLEYKIDSLQNRVQVEKESADIFRSKVDRLNRVSDSLERYISNISSVVGSTPTDENYASLREDLPTPVDSLFNIYGSNVIDTLQKFNLERKALKEAVVVYRGQIREQKHLLVVKDRIINNQQEQIMILSKSNRDLERVIKKQQRNHKIKNTLLYVGGALVVVASIIK
jgi:hypothetical protein